MHPLAGNAPVQGLYYPDLPEQWPTVEALMTSRQPQLQGPLNLIQGGQGLIYRIPVFIDDEYWGLVSTVIDATLLFSVLEEYSIESDLSLSLKARGESSVDSAFWRSSKPMGALSGSVSLELQGVEWVLTVSRSPASGWLDNSYRLIGWLLSLVLVLFVFLIQNISRKRQEVQHRFTANEERLRAILNGTNIGTWEWNVQTGQTHFNERWAEIVGYTLEELTPISIDTWMGLAHPGDLEASALQLQQHFSGEIPFYDIRCHMKHKNGHWVWVHDRGRVMTWTDDGKPLMMFGTHSDVTEEVMVQRALKEQQDLLRVIIDNIPINVYLKDQSGKKIMANRAERLFMGLVADAEDIGLVDSEYLPPDLASLSASEDERVLTTGESILAQEHDSRGPDGQPRWQLVSKIPLRNAEGVIDRILGITVDITERKKAEIELKDSESRLRALFELSPVGIALNDFETGAFLDVNDALLVSSGYQRDEFLELTYWQVTPEEYLHLEAAAKQSLETTGQFAMEKEYINRWGKRYPVRLNGVLIEDREGRKLIWTIIEDISESKKIERLKQEFVSTVSHELRTPLTSITGALGLVQGGAFGQLPNKAQDMVAVALDNSKHLTLIINDLLDMDKLIAGKMRLKFEHVDPVDIVAQSIRENAPYADQYHVIFKQISSAERAMVNADSHRLKQVLNNLLSNAAKFTREGTEVEVRVEVSECRVQISVKDQGFGIPDDFADKVFNQFSQADGSDTRHRSGTGLGLAISKQLMAIMGGSIGYETEQSVGSTFIIEFPRVHKAD